MTKRYEVTKTFTRGTLKGETYKVTIPNCTEPPFTVGEVVLSMGGIATYRVDKVVESELKVYPTDTICPIAEHLATTAEKDGEIRAIWEAVGKPKKVEDLSGESFELKHVIRTLMRREMISGRVSPEEAFTNDRNLATETLIDGVYRYRAPFINASEHALKYVMKKWTEEEEEPTINRHDLINQTFGVLAQLNAMLRETTNTMSDEELFEFKAMLDKAQDRQAEFWDPYNTKSE